MKLPALSVADWMAAIRSGNRTLLAQAITLLESTLPAHREMAEAMLLACLPDAGKSWRVGITGVPGVGKSTFINAMGQKALSEGYHLAVLAVDPSSQQTKGSILGDKTRMEGLITADHVFIRPTPAGQHTGGVANSTRETILLLEAAGFNLILVETVGVGQSEVAVHSMTDVFLLLMLAGAGDELQGIKKGIMEMADVVAINKADGDNLNRAQQAALDVKRALHLFQPPASGWKVPVLTCSAVSGQGIDAVWQSLRQHHEHLLQHQLLEERRRWQQLHWFREAMQFALQQALWQQYKPQLEDLEKEVLEGKRLPLEAANSIVRLLLSR